MTNLSPVTIKYVLYCANENQKKKTPSTQQHAQESDKGQKKITLSNRTLSDSLGNSRRQRDRAALLYLQYLQYLPSETDCTVVYQL